MNAAVASFIGPDGLLQQRMARWVRERARNAKRYEIEAVRVGYDVSYYPRQIDGAVDLATIDTIEDFLALPCGGTVATYCSGNGVREAVFSDLFQSELSEHIVPFVRSAYGLGEDDDLDGAADDDALEAELDFAERFGALPLASVL